PAQDVRDVRAEDAAVHMGLVDDDEAEVVEDVRPQVVPREDADVQHVRVREDEVRPLAHLPPSLVRRAPVVDRGAHLRHTERGDRPGLILRERLRRVQVERAAPGLGGERVEHGEVERERLPRGGPGRDHHVAAGAGRFPRIRLVRVELLDPLSCERGADRLVQLGRDAGRPRGTGRLERHVRELLALEQVVPLRNGRHRPDGNVPAPGCRTLRLRSHPSNLIRFVPAKGAMSVRRALTIATSDSGGGAGIQADLKAFAAAGVHGTSAIVALTAQNTREVTAIHELPPSFVRAQLDAVFGDIGVDAAKTGMLYSRALIAVVAGYLREHPVPLVVDPVMVASSGAQLLEDDAVEVLVRELFPLATVITPNLPEARALAGVDASQAELAE